MDAEKLTLDLSGDDNKVLAERVSRMQPGDKLELAGGSCFILDESDPGKMATFSVKKIILAPDEGDGEDDDEEDEEYSKPDAKAGGKKISVEWAKNKAKQAEEPEDE